MRSIAAVVALTGLLSGLLFLPAGCAEQKPSILQDIEQAVKNQPEIAGQTDTMFSQPYIDMDEWRDTPYRHRYVHGGFKNTDTRFSFYFPPAGQYKGRFFQYITPVPDSENLSEGMRGEEDRIGFAMDSGAYFVAANGGGQQGNAMPGSGIDPTIGAFRANAAAARYSREVALAMYGGQRPYGYAFGGSGGGFRTISGAENTEGVWDGVVPYVIGSPMAIPNVFTVRTYAMRVLEKRLPDIADAVDVGSNKNPFTDIGLNSEEQAALTEATRMGFPLSAWHAHKDLGLHAFALLFPSVVAADPGYFEDFWRRPGYEGYQPTPSLKNAGIHHQTVITQLISLDEAVATGLLADPAKAADRGLADQGWRAALGAYTADVPVAIQLKQVPQKSILGADLVVVSGDATGRPLPVERLEHNLLLFSPGRQDTIAKLKPGDQVLFSNKNFLAVQTYHRHQVPDKTYVGWDQFRDARGNPIYPQRPVLLGPIFAKGATGTTQTGRFKGKMIVVENLYDTEAFPWQADWYRSTVAEHLGAETRNHFRLWFTDHANHSDISRQKDPTHTISFMGVIQQALRDLSAWVEQGIAPPDDTVYDIVDSQVQVPATADERRGIQPVVVVTANGNPRADVSVGEKFELVAQISVPPGTGKVVSARWDLDGKGDFPIAGNIDHAGQEKAVVKLSHAYTAPGTYFPTLRAASHRQGDAATPYARIRNLGRVRIVVTP